MDPLHRARAPALAIASLLLSSTALAAPTTTTYQYDALGQLIGSAQDGAPRSAYTYDAAGNRISSATYAPAAPSCPTGDTLAGNQVMAVGCNIYSANGSYRLALQSDGAVALWTSSNQLVWWSEAVGSPANLTMNSDGNLVEYSTGGPPIWFSGSSGHPGASLKVGDDGAIRILSQGREVWKRPGANCAGRPQLASSEQLAVACSLYSPNGAYRLTLQADGALALWSASDQLVWWSEAVGSPVNLTMNSDGNLVEYGSSGAPIWFSGSSGHPGAVLDVGNDGTIRILKQGREVWKRPGPNCAGRPQLASTETLAVACSLYSESGAYRLTLQADGAVALWSADNALVWWSEQTGTPDRLVMEASGNLIEYRPDNTNIWTSQTSLAGASLQVGDDGRVRIAAGSNVAWERPANPASGGSAQLASGSELQPGGQLTSSNGLYRLQFQPSDGNVALYQLQNGQPVSPALWSTGGHPGAQRLVMQTDGNLVVYDASPNAPWSSGSTGHPGAILKLDNDGVLRVLSSDHEVWSRPGPECAGSPQLGPNESLNPGCSLYSPNGAYRLKLDGDGAFKLSNAAGQPLWSSEATGAPGSIRMEENGTLMERSNAYSEIWSVVTGLSGAPLTLGDDGIARIGSGTVWSRPWAVPSRLNSGEVMLKTGPTSQLVASNSNYALYFQSQGNLVLYSLTSGTPQPLWSTSENADAVFVAMEAGGNLVIYNASGQAQWSTGTGGHPGAYLSIRPNGRLVIYDGTTEIWSAPAP